MTPKLPLIAGFILLLNTLVSYAQPDSPDNKPKLVIPYGHEGGIGSRFLSIDNRFFVCSDDHKTIIWDVRSGKPLHYLKGTNVVGSADGKLLVTCQQNEVMIWDLASGKSLHLFSIRGSIKSMSFHPLLRLLLVVSDEQEEEGDDKVVKVECYNMTSGKTVLLAGEDKNLQGIAGCGKCDHEHCPAADATFSKDGNFIHVATSKDIRTFSVADLKYAGSKCYPIPVDGAETIRFITNEVVEIYDTEADKATYCLGMKIIGTARSVNPHVLRAYNTPRTIPVSLSPDHRYLAYSGQRFRLIDITSPGKDVLNLEPVQQVYFNAMSSRILVEFEKVTTTAVYDIASAKAGGINAGKPDDGWPPYIFIHHPTMQLELNQKAIDSLWAPPKGDYDKEVFESEKKFYLDQYHEQWRTAQSFYVNGGYLVSLSTGRIISYLHSDIPSPKQSLLSPDGHTIFFSSDSGKFFYDLRNARLLSSTVINEPVQGTMAPDNKHCVFVGKSPAAPIYIYDYLKGKLTKAGTANTLTLPTDVTFSEDGKLYTLLTNSGYRTCPLNGLCPSPANRKKNKTPAKKVADEDDDDEEEEGGEEEEMEDGDEDGITH
ncbi:MAG TPA: WD40 repeat domain-containing protein, partial [Chitinophagaceae bacterium]|nr:WD40 repeat domain-containing protein [Chitinophagaceae bacterium]